MCAGLLMLDKAPRDPIKGSIMQLCIRRTKKKKGRRSREIKDKNTLRRLTVRREGEMRTSSSKTQMRCEQVNSLIKFNPAMFSVFLNSVTRKEKRTRSFLSSNNPEKNSENEN